MVAREIIPPAMVALDCCGHFERGPLRDAGNVVDGCVVSGICRCSCLWPALLEVERGVPVILNPHRHPERSEGSV